MPKLSGKKKRDGWLYPYYGQEHIRISYLRNQCKGLRRAACGAGLLNKCRTLPDALRAMF